MNTSIADLAPPDISLDGWRTSFDETTAVRPTNQPGVYDVDLSPRWSSLVGVLGGSLVAVAVRGIEALIPDRRVRTVATSFSRPTRPGPAQLRVEEIHSSRSITSAVATLIQDDQLAITTRATLVAPRTGVEWSTRRAILDIPVEQCVPIEPPEPVAAFEQLDGLLDPSSLPFTDGPRAVIRGYVRPKEPRPVDASWLAVVSDFFPPPAFVRVAPPTGGISVDLVTHIHHTLPATEDWLAASFHIDDSADGLAVEHGTIATRDGLVLAESFHTRWTAERPAPGRSPS